MKLLEYKLFNPPITEESYGNVSKTPRSEAHRHLEVCR